MRWVGLPLLLSLLVWPPQVATLQCRPAREFWDSARQQCRNCSRCAPPAVVLRPCGVHRDAMCGPISDLNIDWSWINGRRRQEPEQLDISLLEEFAGQPPTRRHHHERTPAPREHVRGDPISPTSEASDALSSSPVGTVREHRVHHAAAKRTSKTTSAGRKRERKHKKHSKTGEDPRDEAARGEQRRKHKKRRHDRRNPAPEASFLKSPGDAALVRPEAASQVRPPQLDPAERAADDDALLPEPRQPEAPPFSAAESLVWDGQAFALALAVFACLFFFVVAAVYSVYQARHWRRLKNNFEADVEELSAQLSLVASGCVVEQQPATASPPIIPSDGCGKRQCSYLEQLLACKQEREQANVYIERQSSVREPTRPPSTRE